MLSILALVLALLFAPAYTPPPEQCAEINTLLGGETLPWIGYPAGWDLPPDITRTARIDFAEDGGVWLYEAPSQPGTRWYWWFFSYQQTADANGDHFGAHEFCAVIVRD